MEVVRTLTTILYDKNPLHLQKVQGISDCVMMVVSREFCESHSLSSIHEFHEPTLYILTDDREKVYIGQARSFANRVKDHLAKKDWWTKAYVFVSDAGRYDIASVDYLEYLAITTAQKINRYDCSENKQTPNQPTLRSYERPKMDEAFEEVKFFLNYERCFVFVAKEEMAILSSTELSNEVCEHFPTRFYLKGKDCDAEGYIKDFASNHFVVLKGSKISSSTTALFRDNKQREQLLQKCRLGKGGVFLLQEDYEFSSPSGASTCCLGSSSNGWIVWKDAEGHALKQYLEENK